MIPKMRIGLNGEARASYHTRTRCYHNLKRRLPAPDTIAAYPISSPLAVEDMHHSRTLGRPKEEVMDESGTITT
jgi:hypothetical protein